MKIRRRVLYTVFLIAGLTIGASSMPSGYASYPTFDIVIDSGSPYFQPSSAQVTAGAPIRWDNPTPSPHTVTHDGCIQDDGACAFDSGALGPNEAFTVPGLPPGRYPYHCRLHPIMRGTIIVKEAVTPSQT